MTKKLLIVAALAVPAVLFVGAVLSPAEPDFEVVRQGAGFELRRYEPFAVAETRVEGDFGGADARGSERLVGYVQRGNQGNRHLPLRAPFRQQPLTADGTPAALAGTTLDTTATEAWLMQFVMPREYLMSMLPPPADPAVSLRQLPAHLVAARRYRGNWRQARFNDQAGALLAALSETGLEPIGMPIFARYNVPLLPGFLRRNEVLIEVREPPSPGQTSPD